jgi:hypothetical protein
MLAARAGIAETVVDMHSAAQHSPELGANRVVDISGGEEGLRAAARSFDVRSKSLGRRLALQAPSA